MSLAEWTGIDGKKYATDDPSVVAQRRSWGHDTWTVFPPCACGAYMRDDGKVVHHAACVYADAVRGG